MSITFTKLFASITESTVWCESAPIRITWITMLAMADRQGRVHASLPGLANRARVELEEAAEAIEKFLAPDPYSRTRDHDGRRIEEIDGGWRLLNHAKYRQLRDEETTRESKRRYAARKRAESRKSRTDSNAGEQGRDNAEAEAEADADVKDLGGRSRNRRDELFEALAEACAWPLDELTNDARGRLNAAAKQLRELKATPDQVRERATRYRKRYPDLAITPQALTGHWAALAGDGKSTPRHETEDERQQRERQERTGNAQSLFRLLHEPNSLRRLAGETADAWCDRVEAAWAEHTGQSKCQA